MKCSMEYGAYTYGNSANAPKYGVKLTRRKKRGEIAILFDFEDFAAGRGIGQAQGRVLRVSLRLPRLDRAGSLSRAPVGPCGHCEHGCRVQDRRGFASSSGSFLRAARRSRRLRASASGRLAERRTGGKA